MWALSSSEGDLRSSSYPYHPSALRIHLYQLGQFLRALEHYRRHLDPCDLRISLCLFEVVGRNRLVGHRVVTSLCHLDRLSLIYLLYLDPTLYHHAHHLDYSGPHVPGLGSHGWMNKSLHQVRAVESLGGEVISIVSGHHLDDGLYLYLFDRPLRTEWNMLLASCTSKG